jgi:hypothetical protein
VKYNKNDPQVGIHTNAAHSLETCLLSPMALILLQMSLQFLISICKNDKKE